jgi:hypothetical protein
MEQKELECKARFEAEQFEIVLKRVDALNQLLTKIAQTRKREIGDGLYNRHRCASKCGWIYLHYQTLDCALSALIFSRKLPGECLGKVQIYFSVTHSTDMLHPAILLLRDDLNRCWGYSAESFVVKRLA